MDISVPPYVQDIINTLENRGYEAYVVGGCVRDSLLGVDPKDWDITTDCPPLTLMEIFGGKTVPTGLKHGTVTVLTSKQPVEVTTYRIDGKYSDGRRPDDVEFTADIYEDLARRDFTVNALAYNAKVGILDHFGGAQDLKNKVIRCVGDPRKRFSEDYLRILRAFRFAAKLGFKIDSDTYKTALELKQNLNNIAAERIQKEFNETLVSADFDFLYDFLFNFAGVILPELNDCIGITQRNKHHQYDVFEHIIRAVCSYQGQDLTIKLALVLHDTGKKYCKIITDIGTEQFFGHPEISHKLAEKVMKRLRYPGNITADVLQLVKHHHYIVEPTADCAKRMLRHFGEVQTKRLLEVKIADISTLSPECEKWLNEVRACGRFVDEVIEQKQVYSIKNLAVNGKDIMEHLKLKPSEKVGEILNRLLDEVIVDNKLNEKEKLLKLAEGFYDISESSEG